MFFQETHFWGEIPFPVFYSVGRSFFGNLEDSHSDCIIPTPPPEAMGRFFVNSYLIYLLLSKPQLAWNSDRKSSHYYFSPIFIILYYSRNSNRIISWIQLTTMAWATFEARNPSKEYGPRMFPIFFRGFTFEFWSFIFDWK